MSIGELIKELNDFNKRNTVYVYEDKPSQCVKVMKMSGDHAESVIFFTADSLDQLTDKDGSRQEQAMSIGKAVEELSGFDPNQTAFMHVNGKAVEIAIAAKMNGDHVGSVCFFTLEQLNSFPKQKA